MHIVCICPLISYCRFIYDVFWGVFGCFWLNLWTVNYGQIGDQTGLFYTRNPVFHTSGNRFVRRTGTFGNLIFFTCPVGQLTRIILRPLSALSLDEGLNALNGKNLSAAVWFSQPINCQILARMRISDFLYFRL
jgi:hypothetical protein